ncbi:MAG: succinylglutamate desuccinylase/aspartoacylase family protein [Pirellulaceae bacterium]
MIKFNYLGQSYQTQRVVGKVTGIDGPILVFVGGLHGNERSGIVAMQQVFEYLTTSQIELKGQLIGLAGNLGALESNKRFLSCDLNRIWDDGFAKRVKVQPESTNDHSLESGCVDIAHAEYREQQELFQVLEPLMNQAGPSYFIDLHTTSAHSIPFIVVNDQLGNRSFARHFPIPTILGIEEHIEGPLLSYLNDFGHVALAFEAGQHDDPESICTHVSFIYMAMLTAGVIAEHDIPDLEDHRLRLKHQGQANHGFFEVVFRKAIESEDEFVMSPGFDNFAPISKGDLLAHDRSGPIQATHTGRIFMPLYQSDGNDGFFVVRSVPQWALVLSKFLREVNLQRALTWLPGVSRCDQRPDAIVVNKKIARFLSIELFHLLGYRRKRDDGKEMIFLRREVG